MLGVCQQGAPHCRLGLAVGWVMLRCRAARWAWTRRQSTAQRAAGRSIPGPCPCPPGLWHWLQQSPACHGAVSAWAGLGVSRMQQQQQRRCRPSCLPCAAHCSLALLCSCSPEQAGSDLLPANAVCHLRLRRSLPRWWSNSCLGPVRPWRGWAAGCTRTRAAWLPSQAPALTMGPLSLPAWACWYRGAVASMLCSRCPCMRML